MDSDQAKRNQQVDGRVGYVYVDYTISGRKVGQPFYVGKGLIGRVQEGPRWFRQEISTVEYNRYWQRVVRRDGLLRIVVYESSVDQALANVEALLIRVLKTKQGEPGHQGVNLTWGGDGVWGRQWRHTGETKRKIGLASLGNKGRLGLKHTSEALAEMSRTRMGRKLKPRTQSHRDAMSKSRLGKKRTKESIELGASKRRGKPHPPGCSHCIAITGKRRPR
jgi:hypothetical protein